MSIRSVEIDHAVQSGSSSTTAAFLPAGSSSSPSPGSSRPASPAEATSFQLGVAGSRRPIWIGYRGRGSFVASGDHFISVGVLLRYEPPAHGRRWPVLGRDRPARGPSRGVLASGGELMRPPGHGDGHRRRPRAPDAACRTKALVPRPTSREARAADDWCLARGGLHSALGDGSLMSAALRPANRFPTSAPATRSIAPACTRRRNARRPLSAACAGNAERCRRVELEAVPARSLRRTPGNSRIRPRRDGRGRR